jgi:mRNA interferase RelE/StbE
MKLLIDKSFEKDIHKITDKKLLNSIADCIEDIKLKSKLSEITNCKKLIGSKNCYRIRIGDYRLGFVFENKTIELVRFLHRSKMYDFFP